MGTHQIGLELDSGTWSNLQSEVVTRILALLPFTALVHMRLESRNWDRVVYSGRVLGGCVDSPQRSWLFLLGNASVHAFDPQRDEWQVLTTVPRFVPKMAGLALCAAAGGLMVFAIRAVKSQFVRFGVFNPVTRSWKKLPPLLKRRQTPVVSLIMNGGDSYRIVVAGGMDYDERVLSTEVYDSKSECWRVTCESFLKNQVASHVCEEMRTSSVFCDGILYHMRFNRRLSFDPQRGNPFPSSHAKCKVISHLLICTHSADRPCQVNKDSVRTGLMLQLWTWCKVLSTRIYGQELVMVCQRITHSWRTKRRERGGDRYEWRYLRTWSSRSTRH